MIEPVPDAATTPSGCCCARAPRGPGGRSQRRGYRTTVGNADELELEQIEVPGDVSSAAFLIAAGVLVPGSRLLLENVGVNWTRAGFLRILERMGAIVLGELEPVGAFDAERAGRRPRRHRRPDRGHDG